MRRPATTLIVLLVVATVEFLAWSIAVPALQEPDEASHFSYAQVIAERHEIPYTSHGGPRGDLGAFSPELATAAIWGGLQPLLANPNGRPLWTAPDENLWQAKDRALGPGARRDILVSSAFANPPLAYLYDAVPYKVVGGSFFDRIFAMRWANLPWLLLFVAATWLLAREVFPRRPSLVTLTTAMVVLQPLLVSIAGGVTPDLLLAALWASGLALSVVTVRRGLTVRRVAGLALVCLAAAATHGRGLALVVPALLAIWLAWLRMRPSRTARRVVAAGAGTVVVLGGLVALRFAEHSGPTVNGTRGFLSYLWQFYLPKLPGMNPPPFEGWGVRQVFVERLYGTFGQLDIVVAPWLVDLLATSFLVVLAAGVAAAIARWDTLRRRWRTTAVLVSGLLAELLLVHLQAYHGLLDLPTDPVITGRYLLPLLPVLAVGLVAIVGALPRRLAAPAGGALLGVAVLLQFAGMGAMYARFYA